MNKTDLYKGYVVTKNKKCIEKFKNRTDFKTLEEVHDLPEYAGILAEHTIFVDIDDPAQADTLIKIVTEMECRCRVIKTARGRHFLFRNHQQKGCRTHCTLGIGLNADIKVGYVASYEVLRVDGKDREIEVDFPDAEIEEIPKWLLPVKGKASFLDMAAGDGRNQQLFSYILTLQAADYTVEEARNTIRIINQYVLKDPLPENELETILRDEAFQKPIFFKNEGKTFCFDVFARFLMNTEHIINLNGNLHIYHDGVYVHDIKEIERIMLSHIPTLSDNRRREVLRYLRLICPILEPAESRFIAFKNGIYDLKEDTLIDFSPDFVITNRIPWNYTPDDGSRAVERVDKLLDGISCGDVTIRAMLEECIGYCFYRQTELSKAFMLYGEKANGKSTFLGIVKTLLGAENVSALDMKDLGDRFSTAALFGKLANIGDDIGDDFMRGNTVSTFKKVVSGNPLKAEFKGQDTFTFSPYAKLLFSANTIPRMKDRTGAALRRMVIIPFFANFTEDEEGFDPYIMRRITGDPLAMEYLVRLGVAGLKRILENNRFTYSEAVEKEIREYEIDNNPILSFLDEVGEDGILNEAVGDVYKRYCVFCHENSYQNLSNRVFSKELKRQIACNVKIIKRNKKTTRIYVK